MAVTERGRQPGRVLLVGGTFDPPHRAHVELSSIVAERLRCARIIYLPAARNPLKTNADQTADEHRLAMLRLAVRSVPRAEVSTIELDRGGTSYFVETLAALHASLANKTELHFLIGADQAMCFRRWRDWTRILELADPAVVVRPPWTADSLREALRREYDEALAAFWIERVIPAPLVDVSSTEIRRRLREGEDVADRVDPEVLDYIRRHRLYSGAPSR